MHKVEVKKLLQEFHQLTETEGNIHSSRTEGARTRAIDTF